MTNFRQTPDDLLNAFCKDSDAYLEGAKEGPLAGLTFAAKDIFDVAGHVTGGGNPDWKATHESAEKTAWAVRALVEAGAPMVGKTITDELTRGIFGENAHYGTPVNPRAPGRVSGGSSSGSASAVAGGLVDFALGSDTGGSVRVPASFCGLYGLRPTHGRIPLDGVLLQAPSFDTVGWFARDAGTFARIGAVLLQNEITEARPTRLVIAEDAFAAGTREARRVGPSGPGVCAPGGGAPRGLGPHRIEGAARTCAAPRARPCGAQGSAPKPGLPGPAPGLLVPSPGLVHPGAPQLSARDLL